MKKLITVGIAAIACVALCATVLPRSTGVGDLPAKPEKAAIRAEIETRPTEPSQIFISADSQSPETAEIEESTAEKEKASSPPDEAGTIGTSKTTSTPSPTPKLAASSIQPSSDPKPGKIAVIDGNRCMWVPGFGWVKDEGGGSQGITVGSPGDELTGNKVGQMGGGTIVDGNVSLRMRNGLKNCRPPSPTSLDLSIRRNGTPR